MSKRRHTLDTARIAHICSRTGIYSATLLFVLIALSMLWRMWIMELIASYSILLLATASALLAISVVSKAYSRRAHAHKEVDKRWLGALILSLISFIFVISTVASSADFASVSDESIGSLKISSYNKFISTDDIDKAIDYFKETDTDIVLLQEISPKEAQAMASSLDFEHVFLSGREFSAGDTDVAIISRYELMNKETYSLSQTRRRGLIRAEILHSDTQIALYNTHLTAPFDFESYASGNRELSELANIIVNEQLPLVLGGDFNTSSFSPTLREFDNTVLANNVVTTSQGIFPECSWYGLGPVFCSRIDHIYISNQIDLASSVVSPALDSDHRAIKVELNLSRKIES